MVFINYSATKLSSSIAFICFTILASVSNERGHPLECSGQAGSCVFLIFLFKNQVFLSFKLTLNMATHSVMTSIGVNIHQSPI
ncbi:exported hypothetical protein [Pseudoalteromonas sp. 3J6]|nr:exported hypothetical protein [Pseudoalteromonas sp. 3J6]